MGVPRWFTGAAIVAVLAAGGAVGGTLALSHRVPGAGPAASTSSTTSAGATSTTSTTDSGFATGPTPQLPDVTFGDGCQAVGTLEREITATVSTGSGYELGQWNHGTAGGEISNLATLSTPPYAATATAAKTVESTIGIVVGQGNIAPADVTSARTTALATLTAAAVLLQSDCTTAGIGPAHDDT